MTQMGRALGMTQQSEDRKTNSRHEGSFQHFRQRETLKGPTDDKSAFSCKNHPLNLSVASAVKMAMRDISNQIHSNFLPRLMSFGAIAGTVRSVSGSTISITLFLRVVL